MANPSNSPQMMIVLELFLIGSSGVESGKVESVAIKLLRGLGLAYDVNDRIPGKA